LVPESLFFARAGVDLGAAHAARLDACSECNRCAEVCPSHIPLLDWFRWGKSELHERARAEDVRQRSATPKCWQPSAEAARARRLLREVRPRMAVLVLVVLKRHRLPTPNGAAIRDDRTQ
jgi:electron transport complex protein RnfC